MKRRRAWHEQAGYSMAYWACFLGLLAVPLLVLSVEVGRYAAVAGEIQKAADAAALAAAREMDVKAWREQGDVLFSARAQALAKASEYARSNTNMDGVLLSVTGIAANASDAEDCVRVRVSGDVRPLFPAWFAATVTKEGVAYLRVRSGN